MREDAVTRRGNQDTIRITQKDLEGLQRIASVGAIASSVAHEFNNILTSILNHAKLGLRHEEAAAKHKALEKILGSAQRAAKVTTGILALSRNRSARKEPTDPVELIEQVLAVLHKDLASHQIRLERDFAQTPAVEIVPAQIEQVLMNLIINARQSMADRGTIRVGVRRNPSTGMVEISVADTGRGIPPESLNHIFDPFFSTKDGPDESGRGGSGLGLSICREIIERHQGRIRVESTVGVGTTVTVKLPSPLRDAEAA